MQLGGLVELLTTTFTLILEIMVFNCKKYIHSFDYKTLMINKHHTVFYHK